MDTHAACGFRNFVIALGHGGERIREYFTTSSPDHGLEVELVETGPDTDTGGRLHRLRPWLDSGRFLLSWSDGLSDVDLADVVRFHAEHGRLATAVAVHPPSRFGRLELDGARVVAFEEKPLDAHEWINAGICVLEPGIFEWLDATCSWEHDVLPRLAEGGELMAWQHDSFWQCVDTPKEREQMEQLWQEGRAPWRTRRRP